MGRQLT